MAKYGKVPSGFLLVDDTQLSFKKISANLHYLALTPTKKVQREWYPRLSLETKVWISEPQLQISIPS